MVELWNRGMEWNGGCWLVVVEWWFGGCTKSCLCVSFSGVCVMILSLNYVWVHQGHHHHGRSCARTIGFSIEFATRSVVFKEKRHVARARTAWLPSNAAHEPMCFSREQLHESFLCLKEMHDEHRLCFTAQKDLMTISEQDRGIRGP